MNYWGRLSVRITITRKYEKVHTYSRTGKLVWYRSDYKKELIGYKKTTFNTTSSENDLAIIWRCSFM